MQRWLLLIFIWGLFAECAYGKIQSQVEKLTEQHSEKNPTTLCDPAEEYIQTMTFLRTLDSVKLPETNTREVADLVSRGCRGGAARFAKTFSLLKKIGVEHKKSLQLALEFAQENDAVQENFFAVLKLAYVAEMFDFSFQMALDVAYDFSKKLKSHHKQARNDFVKLAQFCRDDKDLGLPIRTCSQLAIEIAHLSPYYPGGVFEPFNALLNKLRTEKQFGLAIRDALKTTLEVLKHGPTAPANFLAGYE